jgi:hypothetical protein
MKPYHEVNELNLREVNLALKMAYNNLDALRPEARPELQGRIAALEERKRRLEWTEAHVQATREICGFDPNEG